MDQRFILDLEVTSSSSRYSQEYLNLYLYICMYVVYMYPGTTCSMNVHSTTQYMYSNVNVKNLDSFKITYMYTCNFKLSLGTFCTTMCNVILLIYYMCMIYESKKRLHMYMRNKIPLTVPVEICYR